MDDFVGSLVLMDSPFLRYENYHRYDGFGNLVSILVLMDSPFLPDAGAV